MARIENVAVKALDAIVSHLVHDDELISLIGPEIKHAITTAPNVNVTKLNQEYGLDTFITVTINKKEAYEGYDLYFYRVGVGTSLNSSNPSEKVIKILDRVTKILTQMDLDFHFPKQFVFGEYEETYFDRNETTWGYVAMFAVDDEPI